MSLFCIVNFYINVDNILLYFGFLNCTTSNYNAHKNNLANSEKMIWLDCLSIKDYRISQKNVKVVIVYLLVVIKT